MGIWRAEFDEEWKEESEGAGDFGEVLRRRFWDMRNIRELQFRTGT